MKTYLVILKYRCLVNSTAIIRQFQLSGKKDELSITMQRVYKRSRRATKNLLGLLTIATFQIPIAPSKQGSLNIPQSFAEYLLIKGTWDPSTILHLNNTTQHNKPP